MADKNEKGSWSAAKRIVKRKNKRHGEPEHQGLNIYPMMDMMTILLVFLVMQFAVSTAAIVAESDEMQIAFSEARRDMKSGVLIQVSRDTITVDGSPVVRLVDGKVDPGDKQGGSNSLVILPLKNKMEKIRTRQERIGSNGGEAGANLGFTGDILFVVDERTPFRTLTEIINTVGKQGFMNLNFLTDKNRPK